MPSANSRHRPLPTPQRSLAKTKQAGSHAHFPTKVLWLPYGAGISTHMHLPDTLRDSRPHPGRKYVPWSQKYLPFFQRCQAGKDTLTSEVSPALLPSVNNHTFSPLPLTQDKTAGVIGKSQLKVKNSSFFSPSSVLPCINVLLSKRSNHA